MQVKQGLIEDKEEETKKAKEKEERANAKKIDFKAKALKAKENSVKKVVAKAMKKGQVSSSGKGGG